MKHFFTFAVDRYWDTAVESDSSEKAKAVAENEFDYADFGETSLAEGKKSNSKRVLSPFLCLLLSFRYHK